MAIELKPLKEQVIVITGASSGIGLATAEAAAKEGAAVVIAARSASTLQEVAARLGAAGAQVLPVTTDVSRREDIEKLAQAAVARFGRIDTWVNDAGVSIYGRLDEVSEEDSRKLFDINFWGLVNGSLVAIPYLRQQGGALINIGSEVSDAYVPLQGMYSASKHAVKGFTDALRVEIEEVDKAPVSITLIQPTAVDTPFPEHARNYLDEDAKLPTPQIDPFKVADAILKAAVKPTRDVRVGSMAQVNSFLAKVVPPLADKLSAKQNERQTYDQPPQTPEGTLDRPGEAGRTHGREHARH